MGLIKPTGRPSDAMVPLLGLATMVALFAPTTTPLQRPAADRGASAASEVAVSASPHATGGNLEDVRPVLMAIAGALGRDATRTSDDRAVIELSDELSKTTHVASLAPGEHEDADAVLHERRRRAADAARHRSNEGLLDTLVAASEGAGGQKVKFAVALIPDYVDSQSGWMADHIVAGIQAGFSERGYVLDRFHLPDWPARSDGAAGSGRVEHERQPGVVVFRRATQQEKLARLYAVLLVLETPTAGPHGRAFGNALHLVRTWEQRRAKWSATPVAALELDLIGPTFSGSVDPLIGLLRRESSTAALAVRVFNGSANATANDRLACEPVVRSYRQLITDAGVLASAALALLDQKGFPSHRVALLVEDTYFGERAFAPVQEPAPAASKRADGIAADHVFHFPLHVAQLRTASSITPDAARSLLGPPSVPVDIREQAVATDFLPAMRPGMVSPSVEVTFRALLKSMRLEDILAVGIVATDARDALFLARELRRHAPAIQLILLGAQSLYLHPEYAPFVRGALVASTYPLAPLFEARGGSRRGFASQEAEGTFAAVVAMLSPQPAGPAMPAVARDRRCASNGDRAERPDRVDAVETRTVWLSVIGSDAMWPLRVDGGPTPVARAIRTSSALWVVLLGCFALIAFFVAEAVRARRGRGLLTPPSRTTWIRFVHAVNAAQSGAIVATVAFSVGYVTLAVLPVPLPHRAGTALVGGVGMGLLVFLLAGRIAVAEFWQLRREATAAVRAHWASVTVTAVSTRMATRDHVRVFAAICLGALLVATTLGAIGSLLAWLIGGVVLQEGADRTVILIRLVSGGMVSPLPATLLISASLLVPVVWTRLQGTSMGPGYRYLAQHSPAFRYLFGADGQADANLRSLTESLEAPLPSLRLRRLVIVLLAGLALSIVVGRHGRSLDGEAFSTFLKLATLTTILRAALLLLQATQTWRRLRACLGRMQHDPFMAALEAVHRRHINWDVSLFSARVEHLRPIVGLARRVRTHPALTEVAASHGLERTYAHEVAVSPRLPVAVSQSWLHSWAWVEALVPALRTGAWAAIGPASGAALAAQRPSRKGRVEDTELLVALHLAFILRDIVSRVMMSLGNSLVGIGFLTLAHLLYSFQGRNVYLLVDVLCLIAAATVALWLLISVERNFVLSVLRDSKPGHVEFNAAFVRNLGGYVVVPVLAALGAVFPEIGIHFTGMLEPLRRLTTD